MENLFGKICLSDIPKEAIYSLSDQKKYITIIVGQRKNPSEKGQTHYVRCYVPTDMRVEGRHYFIGNLKISQYPKQKDSSDSTTATEGDDGLPF